MEPYSTLEIRQVENYDSQDRNESTKEVINQDAGLNKDDALFRNDSNDKYHVQGLGVDGNHETGNRLSNLPPAVVCKVCGFRGISKTKSYIILTVVILVVISAIVGGVLGGVLRRSTDSEQQDTGGSGPSSGNNSIPEIPPGNVNVHITSRLASSNWTDADGIAYRIVFFQDPNNAIIGRRWDSETRIWTTSNVTNISMGSDNPSLLPIQGTPLASAACYYNTTIKLQLWFLSSAGTVNASFISSARLLRPHEEPDSWEGEEAYAGQRTLPGSQLAAAWQRCRSIDCIGNWVLSYQTPEGHIDVSNASDWGNPERVIDQKDVAVNSSLSLIPHFSPGTDAVDRIVLVSERLTSETNGLMQKSMFKEGEWYLDDPLNKALPSPSPKLQFTTSLLVNFTQTMFLALMPDDSGTVTALLWDERFYPISRINFQGGPSPGPESGSGAGQESSVKFSAISTGEDAVLYGISGDEILAYQPDPDGDDISAFVYVGRVYP